MTHGTHGTHGTLGIARKDFTVDQMQKIRYLVDDARVITHSRMRLAKRLGWDGELFSNTSLGGYPLVYWVEKGYCRSGSEIPMRNRVVMVHPQSTTDVGDHFGVDSYGIALCAACASDESNWSDPSDVLYAENAEGYENGLQCDMCEAWINEPYMDPKREAYMKQYAIDTEDEIRKELLGKLGRMAYVAQHEADRLYGRDDGRMTEKQLARLGGLMDAAAIVAGPELLAGRDKAQAFDDGYDAESKCHEPEDVLSHDGHGNNVAGIEPIAPALDGKEDITERFMVYVTDGSGQVNGPYDTREAAMEEVRTLAKDFYGDETFSGPVESSDPNDVSVVYFASPSKESKELYGSGVYIYALPLYESWMLVAERGGERVMEEHFTGNYEDVIGEYSTACDEQRGCTVILHRLDPSETGTSMEWEEIHSRDVPDEDDEDHSYVPDVPTALEASIADLDRIVENVETLSRDDIASQAAAIQRTLLSLYMES